MKKNTPTSQKRRTIRTAKRPPVPVHQFKKVLVPVDFSKASREALRYAIKFARSYNSQLILLHVIEPMRYPADIGYPSLSMLPLPDNYAAATQTRLAKLKNEESHPGIKVKTQVRVGRPHNEIVRAARELGIDLIILSTHGYTGLKHVLMGSVAERVVQHADCPVLTLRRRQR